MHIDDAALAWEILQRYDDPATARFDAALAAADVPDDVRRALRLWQRESVANVRQYAAEALPAVFAALSAARADIEDATATAAGALVKPNEWAHHRIPDVVITLPDEDHGTAHLREERRRTVAARLAQLG